MDPTSSLPKWLRWLGLAALIVALVLAFGIGAALAQERCEPSVRVDHVRQFAEVADLLRQDRDAESFAKFRQYRSSMLNMAGAMQVKCSGAPPPPESVAIIDMPWTPGNWRMPLPTFSEPVAFRFVVTEGPKAIAGRSAIAEYRGEPMLRQCSVSRTPGDFRPASPGGVNGPFDAAQGAECSITWNLPPGTFYFNVRNVQPGTWPAIVETYWPR